MSQVLRSLVQGLHPREAVEFFMVLGAEAHCQKMRAAAREKAKELFVRKLHVEAVRILIQVGLRAEALDAIKRAKTAHPDRWDPVFQRLDELQYEAEGLPGR